MNKHAYGDKWHSLPSDAKVARYASDSPNFFKLKDSSSLKRIKGCKKQLS